MYQYYIYGLKIDSEIKLYHLDECPNTIRDVHIHYEHMNEKINQFVQDGYASGIFEGSVWFRNSTGIFQIKNGNEIIIQPQPNATEDDVASFILGWCIAFLFMQRGASALHCSALEINNQAVLISGCSGSGKSTLALALLEKGYRYLADDIAMVNPQNDLMIAPAFPMQKVCRNVAEQMDTDTLIYINEK